MHGVHRISLQTGISTDDGRQDSGSNLHTFFSFGTKACRKRGSTLKLCQIEPGTNGIVAQMAAEE
jgi:hypothetical protein